MRGNRVIARLSPNFTTLSPNGFTRHSFICIFYRFVLYVIFVLMAHPSPLARAHFSCERIIRSFTCDSDLMRLGLIGILIWFISLIHICSMTPIVRFKKISPDISLLSKATIPHPDVWQSPLYVVLTLIFLSPSF